MSPVDWRRLWLCRRRLVWSRDCIVRRSLLVRLPGLCGRMAWHGCVYKIGRPFTEESEDERFGDDPQRKSEPRFSRQEDCYRAMEQYNDHKGHWPRVFVDVAREQQHAP